MGMSDPHGLPATPGAPPANPGAPPATPGAPPATIGSPQATPGPQRGEEEEEEAEVPQVESLLLSVAHHWSLRETADRQVELVERHFRQDEMLSSMRKLAEVVGPTCPKVNPRRGGLR